jgi:hypothetical protein
MSSIWEVIPYSFLIDKIFPIDEALEMADDSMLLQAFDISYALSSYKLVEAYESRELATYDIGSSMVCSDPYIEYRRFERVVLSFPPPILPSKVVTSHLLDAPSIDWESIGALVYRFIRR